MKNILVTGGLGFIGFNAVQLWMKERPWYNYVIIDSETYAAQFMLEQKRKWLSENGIRYFKVDIRDEKMVDQIVQKYEIDTIAAFAAESHVDNSIKNPDIFFETNVMGTVNLLNIARKYDLRMHQVSTDEIFGETVPEDWLRGGKEIKPKDMPSRPSSPYSSSKASADMIALSYYRTFGTKVTISRCTNNAGRWQHSEKLIGTVISKALNCEKIPVYGAGGQKRHWIDVDDHNRAIMKMLEEGIPGEMYNVGPVPENWITNMELIKFILEYLGKPESLIEHVADRPGHDTSYFLPASTGMFSTKPYTEFMPGIIDWYADVFQDNKRETPRSFKA